MKRTGKVLNFDEEKVYLMTKEKEFVTVKRHSKEPIKDESYTGMEIAKPSKTIFILTGVIIACILFIYLIKFFFFSTDASIVVTFDTNVKIGINKNRIVKVEGIGGGSLKLVETTSVIGNELNEGLIILLDEALNQQLIQTYSDYDRGKISVYILNEGYKEPLNFTKFVDYAYDHNYDILVNKNDNKIPEQLK
jgi:hypothetical protein